MTESAVRFDVSEAVATLSFNLPARMNPLTPALLSGALAALQRVRDDTSIRALVLTATGKGFCVGADLSALGNSKPAGQGGADASPGLGDHVARLMDEGGTPLVTGLRTLPVPVVCALNGAAVGGGVGIALAADIVVAARSAYFSLPFVPALGLVPDMGCAWVMSRTVGRARSVGLTLLGDRVSAEQAAQWGLIWACVDDDRLADEAVGLARRLAALPAHAVAETRALHDAAEAHTLPEQLTYERERQRVLANGPDFAEGLRAFAEKRRPVFGGRRPA